MSPYQLALIQQSKMASQGRGFSISHTWYNIDSQGKYWMQVESEPAVCPIAACLIGKKVVPAECGYKTVENFVHYFPQFSLKKLENYTLGFDISPDQWIQTWQQGRYNMGHNDRLAWENDQAIVD